MPRVHSLLDPQVLATPFLYLLEAFNILFGRLESREVLLAYAVVFHFFSSLQMERRRSQADDTMKYIATLGLTFPPATLMAVHCPFMTPKATLSLACHPKAML